MRSGEATNSSLSFEARTQLVPECESATLPMSSRPRRAPMTSEFPPTSAEPSTVLLVDDEPVFVRSLARYLGERKYRVETRGSASDAVARVREGGVQVVVSDISMPRMTGVELLRAIREHEPDLPVVLVTGLPAIESAAEAVEYGAFKYIVKPVDPEILRQTVDQAVHVYRLHLGK